MAIPFVLGAAGRLFARGAFRGAITGGGGRGGFGVNINVRLDQKSKQTLRLFASGAQVEFAEREALNGSIAAVQRTAVREVAEEMGVKRSLIRARGKRVNQRNRSGALGKLPTKKASRRRPVAQMDGYGKPFNLTRFGAQVIRGGARTSLKTRRTRQGRGRTIGVVHEAWGRRQSGLGLFRLGKGNSGPVVVRDGARIRGAYGPGVTHVLRYPHIMRELERVALVEYPKRFNERLRYAMSSRSHVR